MQDPSSSIPKGTLLSLLVSMISYIAVVFCSGGAALRDANGNTTAAALNIDLIQVCGSEGCEYGLHNDYSVSFFFMLPRNDCSCPAIEANSSRTMKTLITRYSTVSHHARTLGRSDARYNEPRLASGGKRIFFLRCIELRLLPFAR